MTREDKELLLKDLCGRLPYGVIVDYKENEFEFPHWKITTIYPETADGWIGYDKRVEAGSESGSRPFNVGEVKPYLRSMSSITEEENKEFQQVIEIELKALESPGGHTIESAASSAFQIDFYNKHHLDYRGLIPMGLALEAPEGMYKTE